MATSNPTEEDEHHRRAFSTLRNTDTRSNIALIRDNDSSFTSFDLRYLRGGELNTGLAWQLLGRYIANNTHLKSVDIGYNFTTILNDEKMAVLFGELTCSSSIERIDLRSNEFGINGFRCMVPFLKFTRLVHIDLGWNFLGNECFELLIHTLDGKPIKELNLCDCNITDISALNTNTLPQLETLNLHYNKIGNAGMMIVSDMLQKEGSSLTTLNLWCSDDEAAELLAHSLKHNTTLEYLSLKSQNGMTDIGCIAFLKLVNDVSSIKNTYSSNHTLKSIDIATYKNGNSVLNNEIKSLIEGACKVNSEFGNRSLMFWYRKKLYPNSCRTKVIKYQLHSQRMETLCRFQGIEYSPGSIFADIEPVLLPTVLALIGNKHGQSELYTALIHTAPDLLSYIDRKALIKNALAKNEALSAEYERAVTWYERNIARLGAQKAHLSSRLAQIEGDEAEKRAQQKQSLVEDSSAYDFNDVMAKLQMSHDEYVFPWSKGSDPDDDQRA